MKNLLDFSAQICQTAAGVLIHENKVLLIKHKKLGTWMCPGGHLDKGELHFQAAEREFWEETGLEVKAYTPRSLSIKSNKQSKTQFLPNPFVSNLHWISQENYQARLTGKNSKDRQWSKGCEQHFGAAFLVKAIDGKLNFHQNTEETDGIAWFTLGEVLALESDEIFSDVKAQIELAFKLV